MIEFRTKLDKNKFDKLSNFQFKKILLPLILISIVVIACGIANIFTKNIGFGILWIVFGLIYIPFLYLQTKIMQKHFNINEKIPHPNADETYFFDEFIFTIIQTDGKDFTNKAIYKYSDLYKVYKTKNDYVIYLNKDYVRILPFEALVSGSLQNLDATFSKNLKKNFKIKKFKI